MSLTPQKHYIQPDDAQREILFPVSLAELKTLQSVLLQRIASDQEDKDEAYKAHQDLVTKLEYYITDIH